MKNRTIIDIAKLAGVSVATVSRTLNPSMSHLVREETKKKILKIVRKYKYRPSEIAQILASGRSHYIGILLPIVAQSVFYNDYYMKFFSGVVEVLRHMQYRLHIVPLNIEKDREKLVRSVLENPILEGIIISPDMGDFYFPIERLVDHHVPSVVVSEYRNDLDLNFVYSDSYEGGILVGKFIAEQDFRHVIMVKGTKALCDIGERESGCRKALSQARKSECLDIVTVDDLTERGGYQVGQRIAKRGKKQLPDLIFAANDELAIGILRAFDKAGITCPKDVKVMGYDGLDIGKYTSPSLTTVDQRVSQIAGESVHILVDRIESKASGSVVRKIKPKLIARDSC